MVFCLWSSADAALREMSSHYLTLVGGGYVASTIRVVVYDIRKASGVEPGLRFATTWPPLGTTFSVSRHSSRRKLRGSVCCL